MEELSGLTRQEFADHYMEVMRLLMEKSSMDPGQVESLTYYKELMEEKSEAIFQLRVSMELTQLEKIFGGVK